MKVRDVMRSEPRSCSPGMDLARAGRTMDEVGCGILPVIGEDDRVVGVITDRDICLAVADRDRKPSEIEIRQVISGEVYSCGVDQELSEALEVMRRRRVRRLPVLDTHERLVGVLSLDDVFAEVRARPEGAVPAADELIDTLGTIGQQQIAATRA